MNQHWLGHHAHSRLKKHKLTCSDKELGTSQSLFHSLKTIEDFHRKLVACKQHLSLLNTSQRAKAGIVKFAFKCLLCYILSFQNTKQRASRALLTYLKLNPLLAFSSPRLCGLNRNPVSSSGLPSTAPLLNKNHYWKTNRQGEREKS